jgi:hypothetical protein
MGRLQLDPSRKARHLEGLTVHPEVSPDGLFVAYDTATEDGMEIRVARVLDGHVETFRIPLSPRHLAGGATPARLAAGIGRVRWGPGGKSLLFLGSDGAGAFGVFEQDFAPDVDTSMSRRLVALSDVELTAETIALAPDGRSLAISWADFATNLMLLENLPAGGTPDAPLPRPAVAP